MGAAICQSEFDHGTIASRLREEIARRRISRQGLAETARLSISTLEKGLSGRRPFTLATIVRLEEALGASLREDAQPAVAARPALAPPEMGSYARPAVQWIEGEYLTLRTCFGDARALYAYRTEIRWSERHGHLVFAEAKRVDAAFAQSGFVSMPNLSGHTYLVTSVGGQYRQIVLGRATRSGRMFGLLSTLLVGSGSQLVPGACPIALVPIAQINAPDFGVIAPEHPATERYRRILDVATRDDFCRLKM